MGGEDQDHGNHYRASWCRILQQQPSKPGIQRAHPRVRAALVAVAALALGAAGAQVATSYTTPGSGFSTIATVGADPTGPTGGPGDGGMNGGQFQPPGLPPQMPDYQAGNNLPPLDQNSGISIYNSGAPQAGQQAGGQQGGQQPQQGWDQPAHGTQPPNYSTAPGYTRGPGKPNPDYQTPQQNSPQQGQQQQQPSQAPSQTQQPEQPEQQQQEDQSQQDQGDQQRQQRCQAMSQQMDQIIQTAEQVADTVQQVGDATEIVLPKGGGGSLGPDGERSPGRLPVEPLECGDCPPDRLPQGLPCEKLKGPLKGLCNLANMLERECDPRSGDSECANQVPVCLKKDSWQAFQPEIIAERDEYVRLGNEFIDRNGGTVVKREMTKELNDRKGRETDAARTKDPAKYAGKQVGHGPDMVWGGGPGKLDARDLFPMDGGLNQSIGGQSNAFDPGYRATKFVKGVWSSAPKVKDKRCVATVPLIK